MGGHLSIQCRAQCPGELMGKLKPAPRASLGGRQGEPGTRNYGVSRFTTNVLRVQSSAGTAGTWEEVNSPLTALNTHLDFLCVPLWQPLLMRMMHTTLLVTHFQISFWNRFLWLLCSYFLTAVVITSAFDLASESGLPLRQGDSPTDGAKILSLAKLSQVPIPHWCLRVEREQWGTEKSMTIFPEYMTWFLFIWAQLPGPHSPRDLTDRCAWPAPRVMQFCTPVKKPFVWSWVGLKQLWKSESTWEFTQWRLPFVSVTKLNEYNTTLKHW